MAQGQILPGSPVKITKNGVTLIISEALIDAINILDAPTLRKQLTILCAEVPIVIKKLEDRLLVPGKDVVPYHADTASENLDDEGKDSEVDDQDSGASEDSDSEPPSKRRKPVAIGVEAYTARIEKCENCNNLFDVTINKRGDCVWHPEDKVVDPESETWYDHDEDCHGRCEDLADESDYEGGFVWECCEKTGSNPGCMSTKHKAKSNGVVSEPLLGSVVAGKKRKVGERS